MPILFDLIISGSTDISEKERVLYTIQDLELSQYVCIGEDLSSNEIRNRLLRSDAYLVSGLSEELSYYVLEAMACGLPIVTTACGGMSEAVTDGSEGFVVPIRDSEELARTLKILHEDTNLCRRMGHAGRKRVESVFSLENQVDQFLSLYEHVSSEAA